MGKRLRECETEDEYKQTTIEQALDDYKFFKETRGEEEALKFIFDIVYEHASNAGHYFERRSRQET
ncbi:hypothetical protein [Paenibacillus periandrae]|uniref:hypothetical protein n=1 Tax=Paenibacillus periandrae TaxID=1761741 RepID=UPI001F093B36|nr:hypothetical protein [Paenibacillus periandrae]